MRTPSLVLVLTGLMLGLGAAGAASAQDHPFTLVNVIDLYDFFALSVPVDETFNPDAGPPPNYAEYKADPRLGTNPMSIALEGDERLWIGGFWNGDNFEGTIEKKRKSWYASLGIGEVRNVTRTSGFDGSLTKYVSTVHFGPTIYSTDSFTGLDHDPVNNILYVTFDDSFDMWFPPPGADPQQGSYIAAIDTDPNSPTYGQFLWKLTDPIHPPQSIFEPGDKFYGGVAVDPFDLTKVYVPQNGGPFAAEFGFVIVDATDPYGFDPNDPATRVNVKDAEADCPATFYRQVAFDEVSGDMFVRNANAAERIPRRSDSPLSPYRPVPRYIEEPPSGNGLVDTAPTGDDGWVPPIDSLGDSVTPGQNIIAVGPNGVLDTVPAGDDIFSRTEIVNLRPIGNRDLPDDDGDCNEDPVNGYPNGPFGQGQGIAIIPADNLVDLDVDLVVGNNRPTFGSGHLSDVRFFTIDGEEYARLEMPCSPGTTPPAGIGIYDLDYDPATGTLVVVEFEQRKVYVYKAQVVDGPAYPRGDYSRDGDVDLIDYAGFQRCYTGPDYPGPDDPLLGLACQRMNFDSDCDVDWDDWLVVADNFTAPL